MKKSKALRIVNLLLAIDFIMIVTTAAFSRFLYITGYYRTLHVIPGTIFAALVAVHVFLNWTWIKSNCLKRKK